MDEPLTKRRELIETHILPKLADPIRYSPILEGTLKDLIHSVKTQGLEGLVAKRRESKYEPGLRSGAWQKMRVNQGQELVIAGGMCRAEVLSKSGETEALRAGLFIAEQRARNAEFFANNLLKQYTGKSLY